MSTVEAKAHIKMTPDALGNLLRRRLSEGGIQLSAASGIGPNKAKIKCENMDDLQEFLVAVQNEDIETIEKYIED